MKIVSAEEIMVIGTVGGTSARALSVPGVAPPPELAIPPPSVMVKRLL